MEKASEFVILRCICISCTLILEAVQADGSAHPFAGSFAQYQTPCVFDPPEELGDGFLVDLLFKTSLNLI